ncbi:gluconolactonase [Micromonospora rhizosphaerae]|uniref:Gluconolactonase n=1 Tax=Micromonospora rhizosphaerae TaxID=568872 RepID=A0A1C6RSY5_9ACTN|nr:SMP-30/gluconolactonase/LRE family protein [Micromonospora rhizosphaerae]SCL20319.1 gluconolactonase [Micromonospora rhizosphaerae]
MTIAKLDVAQRVEADLGEGPTWDAAASRLIWVDILGCEVHRLDPATGADDVLRTDQHVGAAKPRSAGGVVVNLRDGIGRYDSDGGFDWLVLWREDGVRGNDAAVDPSGLLWAGTMRYDAAPGGGTLRRVDGAGDVVVVLDDVTISNGTGWSPDGHFMYYVDTATNRVDVFDIDVDTGLVRGRRPLATVDVRLGAPDGLTVDADGCVWVALWGGSAVHRYTPDGALDRVIGVPASQPTACAFGGPALTDLFITTARHGLDEASLADQPLAGSVLVLPNAGIGLPSQPFAG